MIRVGDKFGFVHRDVMTYFMNKEDNSLGQILIMGVGQGGPGEFLTHTVNDVLTSIETILN